MAIIGGEKEGEAAADGGRVQVGDGEGEESRKRDGTARATVEESDWLSVESPSSTAVGNGKLGGEMDAAVAQMSVSEKLQIA